MSFVTLTLLAIGLSFDTFAVSITCGIARKHIVFWEAFRIALVFAFFQSTMPLLGWGFGMTIKSIIEPIDHWLALALLCLIGIKMIIEAFGRDENNSTLDPLNPKVLFTLALATSIDAFAVGIGFVAVIVNIFHAYLIICTVTFIVAMLGMLFGKSIGSAIGKRMEILVG
ncbi:MAG TPA: manganese efflux pump [Bacteroidales bacterium]|nr:manganese efflux pump [Bacteroidales bacterium]